MTPPSGLIFFESWDKRGQKSRHAKQLIEKIIIGNSEIIISDLNIQELRSAGLSQAEIECKVGSLQGVITLTQATEKQARKAQDLSEKRRLPKGDAIHALIARDNRCILIANDRHFSELKDI